MHRIAFATLFAALIAPPSPAVAADAYPQKPIRLLIPFPAGGGTDVLARILQDKLQQALGTSLIIENRAGGAGGSVGVAAVARAAPDGYTLLMTSASFTFAPSLYKDELTYDPIKDFKPITMVASAPLLLLAHPSMPVRSVEELLALARKRPGEINYASAGRGSNMYVSMELFKAMAKINLQHVPYKGGGPAQTAVISGEVALMMPAMQQAVPFVKSGRLRALAVSTKQRTPALPDVPTIDESGVPGYDKSDWFGLFAPAQVPESIISHVYQAAARVLKDPAIVKRFAADGAVAVGNPPEEFGALVRSEIDQWAKIIREMKL